MSTEIQLLFQQYIELYPQEEKLLEPLAQFLKESTELFHRKTLPGHITGSGLIWNPQREQWLVIYHPTFQRWQQTGGHVEPEDQHVWDTALREAKEETTLQRLSLHPWHQAHQGVPLSMEAHIVPANAEKHEQEHYHFDWKYLIITDEDASETSEQKWISFPKIASVFSEPLQFTKVENILYSL